MEMNNAQTDRTGRKKAGGRRLTGYNRVLVGLCETNKSIRICAEKKREKAWKSFVEKFQQKVDAPTRER